jgi:hypothetical protein
LHNKFKIGKGFLIGVNADYNTDLTKMGNGSMALFGRVTQIIAKFRTSTLIILVVTHQTITFPFKMRVLLESFYKKQYEDGNGNLDWVTIHFKVQQLAMLEYFFSKIR